MRKTLRRPQFWFGVTVLSPTFIYWYRSFSFLSVLVACQTSLCSQTFPDSPRIRECCSDTIMRDRLLGTGNPNEHTTTFAGHQTSRHAEEPGVAGTLFFQRRCAPYLFCAQWGNHQRHPSRLATGDTAPPGRRQYHRTSFRGRRPGDRVECPGRVHGVPGLPSGGVGGMVHQQRRQAHPSVAATSWPWMQRSAAPRRWCITATATTTAKRATHPQETPLPAGSELSFAPNGGRPCDGAFPYYRLLFEDGGLAIAIGWPAQWAVQFQRACRTGCRCRRASKRPTCACMPGESIRTPRMTVLSWAGDSCTRREPVAPVVPGPHPAPAQRPADAPMLACAATDEGEEFTAATEENQIRYMDRFKERGIRPRRLVDRCRVVSLLQQGT